MNETEIKTGLESLTKDELIKIFASLDLKVADRKEFLVEAVIAGKPLESEIGWFKAVIGGKEIIEVEKIVEVEVEKIVEKIIIRDPIPKEKTAEPKYIVVHQIQENGKLFKIGDEYTGEFVKRFLGDQIRLK